MFGPMIEEFLDIVEAVCNEEGVELMAYLDWSNQDSRLFQNYKATSSDETFRETALRDVRIYKNRLKFPSWR
jgi:hypothetical protein